MRGFTEDDLPWLYGVVESLEKDGFAAMTEERADYDSGEDEDGETRVKLPSRAARIPTLTGSRSPD